MVVPWRASPDREALWAWCSKRWAATGWKITLAEAPDGPWRKAAAVTPAVHASTAAVVIVADADVWCDAIPPAVHAVQHGAPWAIPHGPVHRLDEKSTTAVLTGAAPDTGALVEKAYQGHEGGGIVVLERATYLDIPLDPRFVGWGRDDDSWALALKSLTRRPWRGDAPLWHLWHQPQPRPNRMKGSPATEQLYRRYRHARNPPAMRQLINEAKEAAGGDPSAHHHDRRSSPTGH